MKLTPQAGPTPVQGALANRVSIGDGSKAPAAQDARARAVAALLEQNPNESKDLGNSHVSDTTEASVESQGVANSEADTSQDPVQSQSAAEANPAEPKDDKSQQPLSAQYAQLARREQALRAQSRALKAREEALKAQSAPKADPQQTPQQNRSVSLDDLEKDPLGTLAKHGFTYDRLTEQAANAPTPEQMQLQMVIDELKSELKSVRDKQDSTSKSIEDSQKQSYDQAVKQIRSEVSQITSKDPEFELIHQTGSVDDVVDLIKETFEKDGYILDVHQAAKEVEAYLEEEAMKLTKYQKIQKRIQAQSAQAKTDASKTQSATQSQSKTLTNTMGTTRQLSARDRAILAMKGELPSS